jgi:hypothetical protein
VAARRGQRRAPSARCGGRFCLSSVDGYIYIYIFCFSSVDGCAPLPGSLFEEQESTSACCCGRTKANPSRLKNARLGSARFCRSQCVGGYGYVPRAMPHPQHDTSNAASATLLGARVLTRPPRNTSTTMCRVCVCVCVLLGAARVFKLSF